MAPRTREKAALLMAGTIVVAFVLAMSRWGTNIGVAPFFICDLLIALMLVHAFATRFTRGPIPRDDRLAGRVTPLFGAFLGYVVLRFVFATGQASVVDWLRDAVPFLYGFLAVMAAYALTRSLTLTRDRTMRLFRWALTIHLLWVAAVSLTGNAGGFDVLGPLAAAPAFEVRPDIDVALVSIAAALSLRQVILGRRRFWNLAAIGLAILVIFGTTSTRAGQISFFLALTASYLLSFVASRNRSGRQLVMLALVPFVIGATIVVLPATTAGQRIIATVAPTLSGGSLAEQNAQGTQRARELTWSQVVEWTNEKPARAILGSGFGNDFLEESGALANLEGTTYTNVRSPHNWFIGIYARLGIVGTILAVLWVSQMIGIMFQERRRIGESELYSFSAFAFVAILPVATLGVVLEAPFGAIPFFYASGVLMGAMARKDSRVSGISSNLSPQLADHH
jgi:hypothetical protein